MWYLNNGIQHANDKCWKITGKHFKKSLFGQATEQPLNNFEIRRSWKYKQLWGMESDSNCL